MLRSLGPTPDRGRGYPRAAVWRCRDSVRGDRFLPEGGQRSVCQHLWHRSDAATGVLLHVLLGLPRNARDADVQKRFRQCRQLQHKRLNGCPFDACDDLPGLVATRVDSSWDAAVGEGVPGRLQVDGRGQSGEAGLVRQWAGSRSPPPWRSGRRLWRCSGNGAFPSRFMRI